MIIKTILAAILCLVQVAAFAQTSAPLNSFGDCFYETDITIENLYFTGDTVVFTPCVPMIIVGAFTSDGNSVMRFGYDDIVAYHATRPTRYSSANVWQFTPSGSGKYVPCEIPLEPGIQIKISFSEVTGQQPYNHSGFTFLLFDGDTRQIPCSNNLSRERSWVKPEMGTHDGLFDLINQGK